MDAQTIGKRFLAGTSSGICLVLVGHPWDTLKVKMQVDREKKVNLRTTIVRLFKSSGIRGFYYGMTAPLFTTGFINTVLWGLQFNLVEFISSTKPAPISDIMKSAVMSGLLISVIVTPVEIVKSQLQVGNGEKGPTQVVRDILRTRGLPGLYRGISAVALVRASNW